MTRTTCILFGAILVVFSLLAFHGLDERGILYHDEGMYMLQARFLDEGFRILLTLDSSEYRQAGFWENIKSETSGVPIHVGKPGYILVVWLGGMLTGFQDSLSAKVSAFSGVLCLILVFMISRRMRDNVGALFATAALASSTFFLIYCRAAFPDQVVAVFFLSGLLLYTHRARTSTLALFLVGLCFGYAFSCNQWRMSYLLAIIVALEIVIAWAHSSGWNVLLKRLLLFLLGYAIPIGAFQLPYVVVEHIAGPLPFPDYWDQLMERFRTTEGLVWFDHPAELAEQYWKVERGVFPSLVVLSWCFLLRRLWIKRRREDLILLSFSLIPFLYFSCVKWNYMALPRTLAITIPVAALCVGELISGCHSAFQSLLNPVGRRRAALTVVVVLLLIVQSLPQHLQAGITRSGYRAASSYLAQTGEKAFMILSMEPIWRFYLGRVAYEPYNRPGTLRELVIKAEGAGIKHLLVDFSTIHSKYGLDYTASLIGNVSPVATFSNPRGIAFAYLLDTFGLKKSIRISNDPASEMIHIFTIESIARALDRGELERHAVRAAREVERGHEWNRLVGQVNDLLSVP
jgi:4-amino-4-deoxy-L-arabinose transferase-like glycosyltransferase